MKNPLLALLASCLLAACAGNNSHGSITAQRDHEEYVRCIEALNDRTPPDSYANPSTRREVVLASCRDVLTRYTVVQEQAYTNDCTAKGRDLNTCDREAVQKAAADTAKLEMEARRHIDETSASAHRPRY